MAKKRLRISIPRHVEEEFLVEDIPERAISFRFFFFSLRSPFYVITIRTPTIDDKDREIIVRRVLIM